jgi:hypothetical protein
MSHDVNGVEIKVGDRVTIEFEVKEVYMTHDFCNVKLRSKLPMPPYHDQFIDLAAVNTRQTVKVIE